MCLIFIIKQDKHKCVSKSVGIGILQYLALYLSKSRHWLQLQWPAKHLYPALGFQFSILDTGSYLLLQQWPTKRSLLSLILP